MIPTINELFNILPQIIIGSLIIISMVIEMFISKLRRYIYLLTLLTLLGVSYYVLFTIGQQRYDVATLMASGGLTNLFHFLFTFGGAIVVLLSVDFVKKKGMFAAEYYILLQSAILGFMILASAKDLLMVFLGLEQMSICFYILTGIRRDNIFSIEASLKYFLLGAFATGFIVYGIALIYGAVGSLGYINIFSAIYGKENIVLVSLGLLLFIIGFSFKIAAFPFHSWVPDVYQGAPTSVTALMSTLGKSAAFVVFIGLVVPLMVKVNYNLFVPFISILAVLSMLYGSIVAIAQTDLKRMLAYSSIAHAGYMLVGIAAGNASGASGVVYYLLAYSFMNLGAFGVISYIESHEDKYLKLSDYKGLSNQKPILAALLAIFMFALSGIPPFAGFFGKYYVFYAAIKADLIWLTIIGVISSAISVYFYLRLVVYMYFNEQSEKIKIFDSNYSLLGIIISTVLVIVMGIFPNSIIELISFFVG